jgi:NAD(P)-dependent dehydrogenase (short-subunit alcohol dehydrogenase family)
MELKDKTIILTGAARIGKFVADDLLAQGVNLTITYRTSKPDIAESDKTLFIQAELTNLEDIQKVIAETKKKFGKIDALVHMAATYERVPWDKLSLETWNSSMDVIAKSAFLTSKLVADEMRAADNGKIILISDWSVLDQPYKDYLPYNVAKAAVVGLTKSLAKELAPAIAVNAIAPGPIIRPPDLSEEENAEALSHTPLGRWGGGEEIARGVIYLLETDFVTGQVLYIDGGRSIA